MRKSENLTERKKSKEIKRDWSAEQIQSLTDLVDQSYNIDFSDYAKNSLSRRITHVIKLFGLEGFEVLLDKIQNEKDFKTKFLNEITVGATEIFRDPHFWVVLRDEIIPHLNQKQDKLKFWVCACSTGEEVFTLAIVLKEAGLYDKSEIIATDLDPVSIEHAKRGFYYNYSYQKNLDNYREFKGLESLDYYAVKSKLGYQMNIDLLKNVIFKQFDLVKENMTEKFDMVLCRNVMIYFNQKLQNKTLKKIKSNVLNRGFLALGTKESIMWLDESTNFESFHSTEKIYQLERTIS